MRLVLDTNVLISGVLSATGAPAVLMGGWLDARFTLVTSAEQLDELRRVLNYPKLRAYIDAGQARDFVENIEVQASLARGLPALNLSPDPDDNIILATAVAGRADALVSGDKAGLIALRTVQGIPIVTPREAVERLRLGEH